SSATTSSSRSARRRRSATVCCRRTWSVHGTVGRTWTSARWRIAGRHGCSRSAPRPAWCSGPPRATSTATAWPPRASRPRSRPDSTYERRSPRMRDHETDSAFVLPSVDRPASVETGVILAGLDTDRLLAGLGMACLGDDPTLVTLLVDQLRHGGGELTIDMALRLGAHRWHAVRPALATAGHGTSVS